MVKAGVCCPTNRVAPRIDRAVVLEFGAVVQLKGDCNSRTLRHRPFRGVPVVQLQIQPRWKHTIVSQSGRSVSRNLKRITRTAGNETLFLSIPRLDFRVKLNAVAHAPNRSKQGNPLARTSCQFWMLQQSFRFRFEKKCNQGHCLAYAHPCTRHQSRCRMRWRRW